jgi:hypothetical protein
MATFLAETVRCLQRKSTEHQGQVVLILGRDPREPRPPPATGFRPVGRARCAAPRDYLVGQLHGTEVNDRKSLADNGIA